MWLRNGWSGQCASELVQWPWLIFDEIAPLHFHQLRRGISESCKTVLTSYLEATEPPHNRNWAFCVPVSVSVKKAPQGVVVPWVPFDADMRHGDWEALKQV